MTTSQPRVVDVAALGIVALGLLCAGCGDDGGNATSPSSLGSSLTCVVSPEAGPAPLIVSLAVKVKPFVPTILFISYGDGTSGNDPNAAHTYTAPGSYRVTVTATAEAQTLDCQSTVTVSAPSPGPPNRAPVAGFRTDPSPPVGPAPLDLGINLCQTVDPDGDRMVFHFDFGDGVRSTPGVCRARHVYSRGSYTAKACVTDGLPDHETCREFNVEAQ
jgi:PKD domain